MPVVSSMRVIEVAVRGGERFIRAAMVVSALLLAAKLIGVWDWMIDQF